ncbi:MAG: hypothetical protein WED11_06345 [Natronospirillum sp.]
MIAGQDYMIAAVDAALGSKTAQYTLDSSHSPFFSQPEKLAKVVTNIMEASGT